MPRLLELLPLLVCLTFAGLAIDPAQAQSSAAEMLSQWANAAPKAYAFVQERHLSILSHPIVAHGVVTRNGDKTIQWHQTDPIDTTVVIGPNGIESGADQAGAALQGAVASISGAVLDIFYGRYDNLKTLFDVSESDGKVILNPRDELLSKVMERIELAGRDQLSQITLVEHNGDSTVIRLMPEGTGDPVK